MNRHPFGRYDNRHPFEIAMCVLRDQIRAMPAFQEAKEKAITDAVQAIADAAPTQGASVDFLNSRGGITKLSEDCFAKYDQPVHGSKLIPNLSFRGALAPGELRSEVQRRAATIFKDRPVR